MRNKVILILAVLLLAVGSAKAFSIFGANPIIETQIADNAITSTKLSNDAVSENSISDNSIRSAKLQSIDTAADEECLTSEGSGFEWQACGGGGGSSVVQEEIVTLTASQLRKLATTPVELLPAPGAGKMYVPMAPYTFSFNAGAFPYVFETVDVILYNDVAGPQFSGNETAVQDDAMGFGSPSSDFTAGEIVTGSVSGATATVVASSVLVSGFMVVTNVTGTFQEGVDLITGNLGGDGGTLDEYVDSPLATANVVSGQDPELRVNNVVGTFLNNAFVGGDSSGAIGQIQDYNAGVPIVGPGVASIIYGTNYDDRFIGQQIDHPTIDNNLDKILIGTDSNTNVYRSPSYYENKAITLKSDFDWTDESDNDSNGDGTATLYLYYQIIDI